MRQVILKRPRPLSRTRDMKRTAAKITSRAQLNEVLEALPEQIRLKAYAELRPHLRIRWME